MSASQSCKKCNEHFPYNRRIKLVLFIVKKKCIEMFQNRGVLQPTGRSVSTLLCIIVGGHIAPFEIFPPL